MSSPEKGLESLVIVTKQNKARLKKKIVIFSFFILKILSETVISKEDSK